MRSIRKGRESPILMLPAALLFLGLCAYLGAFLLDAAQALQTPAVPAAAETQTALWGAAIRRERATAPFPGAEDGKRIRGQGIYFSACDGYESLSPADLEALGPAALRCLTERPPEEPGSARLVEDAAWYYIALLTGGDCPAPGPCRLRIAGFSRAVPARLLSVREVEGERLLLFRLTEGGAYLKLRFIEAEIERSGSP